MKLDKFEPYDIVLPDEGRRHSGRDYDNSYDSYDDGPSYSKYGGYNGYDEFSFARFVGGYFPFINKFILYVVNFFLFAHFTSDFMVPSGK